MLHALREYIANPWVGFAFGIVVLILGWRMSARWANILLVAAWVVFIISAYRTPIAAGQPVLARLLWVMLFSSVLGIALYYTLWTKTMEAPLALGATTSAADKPQGTRIGGILWLQPFGDLRIFVGNPTGLDYQNLDLLIVPDTPITAASQITNTAVSIWREDEPSITAELARGQNDRVAMNFVTVASNRGFRLRCQELPSKSRIEIVMAAVTMNDNPSARDVDKLLVVTFKDAGKFWFVHPDHTDKIFGARPQPRLVWVSGQYSAGLKEFKVSEELKASDFLVETLPKIRK